MTTMIMMTMTMTTRMRMTITMTMMMMIKMLELTLLKAVDVLGRKRGHNLLRTDKERFK